MVGWGHASSHVWKGAHTEKCSRERGEPGDRARPGDRRPGVAEQGGPADRDHKNFNMAYTPTVKQVHARIAEISFRVLVMGTGGGWKMENTTATKIRKYHCSGTPIQDVPVIWENLLADGTFWTPWHTNKHNNEKNKKLNWILTGPLEVSLCVSVLTDLQQVT